MSNNKQSSVEYFWKQLEEKGNAHIETEGVITVNITIDVNEYRLLQKQAKAMQLEQAQQYAEFCVVCDRQDLPLLDFNSWIAHNETFNTKEK